MPVTSSTLVTSVVSNRKNNTQLPATLPWGTPLNGLSVAEFARSFKAHIPLIRAKLGGAPSDRVLHQLCDELSEGTLMFHALALLLQQARLERKSQKVGKQLGGKFKLKQKQEQQDSHTSETEEERSEAEEKSDPVGAAVDFLLGLVGM